GVPPRRVRSGSFPASLLRSYLGIPRKSSPGGRSTSPSRSRSTEPRRLPELDPAGPEDRDPGDRLRPRRGRLDRIVPGGVREDLRERGGPADPRSPVLDLLLDDHARDRKSTRLNSSHVSSSYAVF